MSVKPQVLDDDSLLNHTCSSLQLSAIRTDLVTILLAVQGDDQFTKEMLLGELIKVVGKISEEESFHFDLIRGHFEKQAESLNNTLAGR
ncbi:hypothetical protein [Paenibacillus sp. NRS-1780]|uniref:hypothetical protein n=1 Tax=Paenibacillus sp. NRS-1780 TaxID=3233904 RepID=UPI003D26BE43